MSNSKYSKGKGKCWFYGKSRHPKKDYWKRQQASKEDSKIESNSFATTSGSGMFDEVSSFQCVSPPVFT
jgi:hypothetical protein